MAPEAEGVVTVPSPYPVDDTPARLEAAILDRGLTLFAQVDHAAGAVWVSHTSPGCLAGRYGVPDDLVGNIAGVERLVATALA